ncbi:unnamed protein product [Coccothraustes coccothraustes]
MDSPHLLHLGFLLLALAAPPPSIAMSNAGPAKGTQGNTTVEVYYCKNKEICECKNERINFKNFTKIAVIQNKTNTNPDLAIELVTNESHISVCFEQANSSIEGIYGIYSKETYPPKLWCGILNSGENGRGNISPEDKHVCCEAKADAWRHTPKLKCYIQKSPPKHSALPVAIAGKPEFLTSKKNSLGILFAFLFVGVCAGWGTMFYFLRLRRRQGTV